MADHSKRTRLFVILGSFFIANALIAEFIGSKIFSLERTLGFEPLRIAIWGEERSFDMTAGVLLWPMVFIMTDIINEYFGRKGVKRLSYLAVALISYSFLAVYVAMSLSPADFWAQKKLENGSLDMDLAFNSVFGQGLWIIIGSLVAFLIGQLLDVFVFHQIKRRTGEKHIWLRATGSTLISQLIDSFIVLLIAFYFSKLGTPDQWPLSRVISIGVVNYIYKFVMALVLTPLLYLVHGMIERYLGVELATRLKSEAQAE